MTRLITGERLAAAVLLGAAVSLLGAWGPLAGRRTHSREARLAQALRSRDFLVSPAEVLALLRDRRVAIELFDLRDEADYALFHLADACRLQPTELERLRALPVTTVKILMGDDESRPIELYRRAELAGIAGVYVLEGGVRAWLQAFSPESCRHAPSACNPRLALGDRHPASQPDPEFVATKSFVPKVKAAQVGKKLGSGCGG
jgi:rhodanese-related sulfurtransferase